MKIYIDESGIFKKSGSHNNPRTSNVGALVILESEEDSIFAKFKEIKASWGDGQAEYKGSKLSEEQVATVITMLSETNTLFFSCLIDMSLEDNSSLLHHREMQAKMFVEKIDQAVHESLRDELQSIATELRSLSLQLYIQMQLLTNVVDSVLRYSQMYFVQRQPEVLSQFKWMIDAKDIKVTKYELLWVKIVNSAIQSLSVKNPHVTIVGADYSYMDKFLFTGDASHLPIQDGARVGHDLKKILNDISFESSNKNLGLQLVDILTTTTRRTCNGHFQENGWRNLGKLTIQPSIDKKNAFDFVTLSGKTITAERPYFDFIRKSTICSRQMLLGSFYER